jgi:hypothetical protein
VTFNSDVLISIYFLLPYMHACFVVAYKDDSFRTIYMAINLSILLREHVNFGLGALHLLD